MHARKHLLDFCYIKAIPAYDKDAEFVSSRSGVRLADPQAPRVRSTRIWAFLFFAYDAAAIKCRTTLVRPG